MRVPIHTIVTVTWLIGLALIVNVSWAWEVGYSEADITPPAGQAMMAGFGRERYAGGTIAPLRAQAIAFRDRDGRTAALVTADVLGFGRVSVEAMRRQIEEKHQLPAKAICFSASHTHWGPAINYRTNFGIGGPNVWYIGKLEETLVRLVGEAIAELSPATITYSSTQAQIGACRRNPNERGEIGWGPYLAGSYDSHTPIVQVRRSASPQQIVLVGHACHPTSSGAVGKWSPDYPGAMRRKLEQELPDSRAMFVMGCGGDAKVVVRDESGQYRFAADPQESDAAGIELADQVLRRLGEGNLSELQSGLRTTLVRGSLSLQPPRNREEIERMAYGGNPRSHVTWWAGQSLAYPDHRRRQRYEVQAWQLGELTIVALEGEVCADWGPMTRALAGTEHAMVIAYANHCPGYIPTARIVREGGYEGNTSHMAYFLPAPFEPRVETELTRLVQTALSPNQARPTAPPVYPDKTNLLRYISEDGEMLEVTTAEQWQVRRAHIAANLQRLMGPLPGDFFRVPLDIEVLTERRFDKYIQRKIAYNVDPHDRVESYLLIPADLPDKAPAVLALHPTHKIGKDQPVGLDGKPSRFYARELVERGYIVIAPDYWPMGHYAAKDYDPYRRGYASGSVKGVWGHIRAVDVLESLPEVDRQRIGCIGHSLGGYNAIFVAVHDLRIKAVVSSAGYNSFADYAASDYGKGDLANWARDVHIRRIGTIYENDPGQVPVDFTELVAALAPRPFFTSAPIDDHNFVVSGVTKCIKAARPVYQLLDADEQLVAVYPDGGHDFPAAQRQAAYDFLDSRLRK